MCLLTLLLAFLCGCNRNLIYNCKWVLLHQFCFSFMLCVCVVHTLFHELDISTRNYVWSYRILCMCIGHIFDKMCSSLWGSGQLKHSQIPLAQVFFVRTRSRSHKYFSPVRSRILSHSLLTHVKTHQVKVFPSDQGALNDCWRVCAYIDGGTFSASILTFGWMFLLRSSKKWNNAKFPIT